MDVNLGYSGHPVPAKARTARCAGEQDHGGGSGVEGEYAVGFFQLGGPGFFGGAVAVAVSTAREERLDAEFTRDCLPNHE